MSCGDREREKEREKEGERDGGKDKKRTGVIHLFTSGFLIAGF